MSIWRKSRPHKHPKPVLSRQYQNRILRTKNNTHTFQYVWCRQSFGHFVFGHSPFGFELEYCIIRHSHTRYAQKRHQRCSSHIHMLSCHAMHHNHCRGHGTAVVALMHSVALTSGFAQHARVPQSSSNGTHVYTSHMEHGAFASARQRRARHHHVPTVVCVRPTHQKQFSQILQPHTHECTPCASVWICVSAPNADVCRRL